MNSIKLKRAMLAAIWREYRAAKAAIDHRDDEGWIRAVKDMESAVEALEADQSVRKYTIDELKGIKAVYVRKLKMLMDNAELTGRAGHAGEGPR